MDPPDILFWCCSRQWWWCCLNWKRPGAVSVEFSMARQWGDTAILSIFSDIDMDFSFNVEYFPPTIFFITYQYKSTNNLHLHLQDAADVEPFVVRKVSDHNNEQLNLREVEKLLRGKSSSARRRLYSVLWRTRKHLRLSASDASTSGFSFSSLFSWRWLVASLICRISLKVWWSLFLVSTRTKPWEASWKLTQCLFMWPAASIETLEKMNVKTPFWEFSLPLHYWQSTQDVGAYQIGF